MFRGKRMRKRESKFETQVIHEGYDGKEMKGSVAIPLYQTSSFEFETAERGEASFTGEDAGYIYSRLGNPTVSVLEERIAALEGAESGLAFASGMGAISAVLLTLTKANDHVLCSTALYGSTYDLFMMMEEKYNIGVHFSDLSTKAEIRQQITDKTVCIYVETPVNPTMQLVDLQLVSEVAKEYGIPVIVDNTFSTPYLQRPIELGCDIVVHSATKYLNGHGDVIAGLVVGDAKTLERIRTSTQRNIGAVLAPFDAWLLLRGMKTLPLRMDRHCDNAEQIVAKLREHPSVKTVFYPSEGDSGVFEKQMRRAGGVISFALKGSKTDVQAMLNRLGFIKVAVSLGDAETLIQHPASMTHAVIPEEKRLEMGITNSLVRLSVGIEAWEDIWDDLQQALDVMK